ncbi:MAG: hypothetical protein HRU12_02765 [Phaeodactylibacter sp.]|nr:hypothetical protein [Phaeodactylibacter sp.]
MFEYPTTVNLGAVMRFEETTKLTLEGVLKDFNAQPWSVKLRLLHAFVYEADPTVRWVDFENYVKSLESVAEINAAILDCIKKYYGTTPAGESA